MLKKRTALTALTLALALAHVSALTWISFEAVTASATATGVSAANTVTVSVCAPIIGTPVAATYNVRVVP